MLFGSSRICYGGVKFREIGRRFRCYWGLGLLGVFGSRFFVGWRCFRFFGVSRWSFGGC